MDAALNSSAKSTVAPQSLLELLMAGIAAIDLASEAPPTNPDAPGDEVTIVGEADDYLKRVFCVRRKMVAQVEALKNEAEATSFDILGAKAVLRLRSIGSWLLGLMDGNNGRREKAERLAEVEALLEDRVFLINWANDLFWAEVKRRLPESKKFEQLTIFHDWRIGGSSSDFERSLDEELSAFLSDPTGKSISDAVERLRRRFEHMQTKRS